MPLDKLKIDRSFIREVAASRDDAEIVRAIVSLAHSLHLKVIAEGVETAEQLTFLRGLGCDQYQGFHCSPPVPADEFETDDARDADSGDRAGECAEHDGYDCYAGAAEGQRAGVAPWGAGAKRQRTRPRPRQARFDRKNHAFCRRSSRDPERPAKRQAIRPRVMAKKNPEPDPGSECGLSMKGRKSARG